MARKIALWTGIAIMICGLLLMARVPFFFGRAALMGGKLVALEETRLKHTQIPQASDTLSTTPTVATTSSDDLTAGINPVGLLQIPQLHLTAPILEGDGSTVLSVAVGHLESSVLPGKLGLAVLAAHNATWFRNIDQLHNGALVDVQLPNGRYEFKVSQTQIVKTGTPVANTPYPAIMLETCYPLDALYLTPYRYLVTARLVKQVDEGESARYFGGARIGVVKYLPEAGLSFLPTFAQSGIPMGSLAYAPDATPRYEDSPAPLSAANLMARLLAGFERESAKGNRRTLRELVTEPLTTNPFWGSSLTAVHYESDFNVTLTVSQTVLSNATARIDVIVNERAYQVTLLAHNDNGRLALQSVRVVSL
ncbi:MAG: class D sortase [Firmicutes bacterium]|nr:class D sortase [Bacillota bacterium]